MQESSQSYPQERYRYKREFDPEPSSPPEAKVALRGGDRPEESPYSYNEEMILAINVALAANRPLLVAGPPGTGKSALAQDIAKQLGNLRFASKVITGRTEGRDLLWRFDAVRRLGDAHLAARGIQRAGPDDGLPASNYVERGVLWEAFAESQHARRMVILIDEIDKAEPDVPNSLLEVLGNGTFHVDETGADIHVNDAFPPFIVITTNDERELSRPFRRRCVTLTLKAPDKARLVEIANAWGLADMRYGGIAERLAERIEKLAGTPEAPGELTPNAAEYLDALRACINLRVSPDPESEVWRAIEEVTLRKRLGSNLSVP